MQNPIRRLMTLPAPATIAVLYLAFAVPIAAYLSANFRQGQIIQHPTLALIDQFPVVIGIGRSVGAIALAAMLLYWRRPTTIAVVVTAVWLAGPPLDYLLIPVRVLALSGGTAAWYVGPYSWLGPALLTPILITGLLSVPRTVRSAFGVS